MKKFLSILVCMFLLVSSLGTITTFAANLTKTINVPVSNSVYTLPTGTMTTDNGEQITVTKWSEETADVSKVGYQLFTAVSGEDTVTLRLNAGDYSLVLSDDMEGHNINGAAESNFAVNGGTASVAAYSITPPSVNSAGNMAGNTTDKSAKFVLDGNKKVLSLGPEASQWSTAWTPAIKPEGGFKIAMKIRTAAFDMDEDNVTTGAHSGVFMQVSDKQLMTMNLYTNSDNTDINNIFLRMDNYAGKASGASSGSDSSTPNLKSIVSGSVNDGIYSMNDYMQVEIEAGSETYGVSVNGVEQRNGITLPLGFESVEGVALAKRSPAKYPSYSSSNANKVSSNASNVQTYIDDLEIYRLVYPSGKLADSIDAKVMENATGIQTAQTKIMMSDGSEKTLNVKYDIGNTPVTNSGKATGSIEGYSETVEVNYTVVKSSTREPVYTYVGADVTLSDGQKVDTGSMGKKVYTINGENTIIYQPVYVGEYVETYKDNMESHTKKNATATSKESVNSGNDELVVSMNTIGTEYKSSTYSDVYQDESAVVREKAMGTDSDNKTLAYLFADNQNMTATSNLTWNKNIDGAYRFSTDIKLENGTATASDGKVGTNVMIRLYDKAGNQITNGISFQLQPYNSTDFLEVTGQKDGVTNAESSSQANFGNAVRIARKTMENSYPYGVIVTEDAAGVPSTNWFTLSIDVHEDRTYDVLVNGVIVKENLLFQTTTASCNFGSVTMGKRSDRAAANSYLDNLTLYKYNCYDGNLAEDIAELEPIKIGQGANRVQIPLTLTNGEKKFFDATVSGFDKNKLGAQTAKITVDGFDSVSGVDVEVGNYIIDNFLYKAGSDESGYTYTKNMEPGCVIDSVNVVNIGNMSSAKAFFAWYDNEDTIKAVKAVDLTNISTNNEVPTSLEVGLQLPENLTGGKLKVFVLNSALTPLDLAVVKEYSAVNNEPFQLLIASDSTYHDYSVEKNSSVNSFPRTGIGQTIGAYLTDNVMVVNHAQSGAHTASFIIEGRWERLMDDVNPGDYVLIAFGHNDQGRCGQVYDTETSSWVNVDDTNSSCSVYKTNMERFINDVQNAKANVILATPIARLGEGYDGVAYETFNSERTSTRSVHNHLDQLNELGLTYNVPVVDMSNITEAYICATYKTNAGKAADLQQYQGSVYSSATGWTDDVTLSFNELYMNHVNEQGNGSKEDGVYNKMYDTISDSKALELWNRSRYKTNNAPGYYLSTAAGRQDNTHLTYMGAHIYAELLAQGIKDSGCLLSKYVDETVKAPKTFAQAYQNVVY